MSTPGGGHPTSAAQGAPSHGSSSRMHIDPAAIGAAKQAFSEALDGVHDQLRRIHSARQQPWAGDPVSAETANAVNSRTSGGDEEFNAENVLSAYARQLANVVDGLEQTEKTYRNNEGANQALLQQHMQEG